MSKSLILSWLVVMIMSMDISAQQIAIDRIDQMPDLPQPYQMRDWGKVAQQYDSLVFDYDRTGSYWPIVSLGAEGVNYPQLTPIFMDSYVGSTNHGNQREAINILPAIVGSTLVGLDKSNQRGVDWVTQARDFFNLKNGEKVYLNGPSGSSGHDWWYETMPNVFFYQLYELYPDVDGFESQFTEVADRWLEAVTAMGGSNTPWQTPEMNYRAWNLTKMEPLDEGVREPESAGAIAWILYQAYKKTSEKKYFIGAEWALDFLDAQTANPSYELQLPYGALTAAQINATLGTDYDIQQLLEWCFNRGELRGWGSIVGTWDGYDVSGLIGEANDGGNDYAFLMNGFQQAAALAPLVKYDKRFAKAIAKWILNVANASRLFYSKYIPEDQQSDYDWSSVNDLNSVIAYEAIKEKWNGISLYARGDSKDAGWAQTNLGLYGSSHVGYLGGLIDTTDVEGVLKINLNRTDFYGDRDFPVYLLYNPHSTLQTIQFALEGEPVDLYDAISEATIAEGVQDTYSLEIPAGDVRLIILLPAGTMTKEQSGRLVAGDKIVDYHYGYDYTPVPRIRSLAVEDEKIEIGSTVPVYCTVAGMDQPQFAWYVDGVLHSEATSILSLTPESLGVHKIQVTVSEGEWELVDSLEIEVVELIPVEPEVNNISSEKKWYNPGDIFWIEAQASDPKNLDLIYDWTITNGTIQQTESSRVQVQAQNSGVLKATLTVSNYALSTSREYAVLVAENGETYDPLIRLPLNGFSSDVSSSAFTTELRGGEYTDGPLTESKQSLLLRGSSDELLVKKNDALNFSEEISISLWAYFTDFNSERFIISHGGWQQRWKLSTTPERKLRWTVNTSDGIRDLDAVGELYSKRWYQVVAIYNGQTMQLFLDGVLNAFSEHTGTINAASVDLSIGKRLPGDDQYYLKGRVDEVRIYKDALYPNQAEAMINSWSVEEALAIDDLKDVWEVFPNPVQHKLMIKDAHTTHIDLMDLSGKKITTLPVTESKDRIATVDLSDLPSGVYLIRRMGSSEVKKIVVQ